MVNVAKDVIQRAKQQTAAGQMEYKRGEHDIDTVMAEVTSGKIGGDVAKNLKDVWDSTKGIRQQADKYFTQMDELMQRANQEYDRTTEETSAALNRNRF